MMGECSIGFESCSAEAVVAKEHVLIIDRNLSSRAWLIDHIIGPADLTCAEAGTLEEARARSALLDPHVIFLNLSGNLNQTLNFIKAQPPSVAVVALTSSQASDVTQAALQAGAVDVVVKPASPDRIAQALERALRWVRLSAERDQLRTQADRQRQEFNAIYTVGKQITALLDLEQVLGLVVTSAVNLTGAEEGALMLLDTDTGELYLRASRNLRESAARKTRFKVTDTLIGRVVSSRRPINMTNDDLVRVQTSYLVKSIMCVPLLVGERVIGVLSVDNALRGAQFSEHDLHLLSTLADYAAIAIENAQLYEETRRRANELAALIEIDRHISSTLDLTQVLERIATHARDLLAANDSEVYLVDASGERLRAIVALGAYAAEIKASTLRLGEGIVGSVALTGEAEMVNDAARDPRSIQIPGTPDESESILCAPLRFKNRLQGVMAVVRTAGQAGFRPADLEFFKALAGQAAIAIENARLYAAEHDRASELARTLEQQRELDRLKNEFIQNISHELRTPLAVVRGYAELLDSGELGSLSAEQRDGVRVMTQRTRWLSKMLDDLLAILAAETRKMANDPIDLVALVDGLRGDFQAMVGQAGLTLAFDVPPIKMPITGDPVQLRRVFDNLVSNAVKFTPAGGRIQVRLRAEDGRALLEVTDTGIGIPAGKIDRIFDRFYQVDGSSTRRYGGVGLGLALVKEIIIAHGGEVQVQSVVGEGSTFRVVLPLADSAG